MKQILQKFTRAGRRVRAWRSACGRQGVHGGSLRQGRGDFQDRPRARGRRHTAGAALVALLCAGATLLSGCEFTPTDITNLMRPPRLTGSQQAIENALEENVGSKYLLKYPLKGKYHSPFILHDLDGDGKREALVLYTPQSENAGTHIMVFRQASGKWTKQCDISGDGNEVNSIDFGNYDGSGRQYLTVGWTLFNSSDFGLCVYGISKNGVKKIYKDTYTAMDVIDLNGDKRPDLLLFNLESSGDSRARLISYAAGSRQLQQVASAPLDGTVSSYAGLYESKLLDGSTGVLIDGYKGAHSMVTELICWKNGQMLAPFYNKDTHTASATLRNIPIPCNDIDFDSYVEIPLAVELPGYEDAAYSSKIYLVRWNSYTAQGTLRPKFSCIPNFSMGYYVKIPSAWENHVTVQSSDHGRIWNFRMYHKGDPFGGSLLFTLSVYSEDQWDTLPGKNGMTVLQEDSNKVYAIRMGPVTDENRSYYVPEQQIATLLKLYSP